MADEQETRPRRQRKKGPKVKSGCLTCKIRRVKCGEEKPICRRCITFGVVCDGYPPEIPPKSKTKRPIKPKVVPKPTPPRIPLPVIKSPFANAEEHQYFNLFCSRTGFEILPAFDNSTRQTLLQFCHSHSSIRHAIVAIGALDKTSEVIFNFDALSLDSSDNVLKADTHHHIALQQYSKAIKCMRERAAEEVADVKMALLNCLLIFCFESWTGNLQNAVLQVQSGVRIIQQWKRNYEREGEVFEGLSPAPNIIDDGLVQIFCRVAFQIMFFTQERSVDTKAMLGSEGKKLIRSLPERFTDMGTAMKYHQGLIRSTGSFMMKYEDVDLESLPDLQAVLAERQELVDRFHQWFSAFQPLYSNLPAGMPARMGAIMKLSLLATYTGGATALEKDEMVHDQYNEIYREIADLSEAVLNDMPQPSQVRSAKFSFDTRLIMPLWLVGMKCRLGKVREKIIHMMLLWHRREGVWDSRCAGRMIQWVKWLEEAYAIDGFVPGWARVMDVRWSADLEHREAFMSCEQKNSPMSEPSTRRTKISW